MNIPKKLQSHIKKAISGGAIFCDIWNDFFEMGIVKTTEYKELTKKEEDFLNLALDFYKRNLH